MSQRSRSTASEIPVPSTTSPHAARESASLAVRASVIVVNYNGGAHLRTCLAAVERDRREADEVILVDNASTDGSADEVERSFPRVRVIRSAVNLGFGGGNNLGAALATGTYLAFLNPDTVVEPGWLTALVDAIEADPRVGLVTSKILLLNEPGRINTCGNDVHCSGLTLCRGMGRDRAELASTAEVGAVSGAAFVVRRDLFAALGGFDSSFFLYVEDTDLSLRARLAGYRCVYVPASVVYHDYTLRFGPQKAFYQERNRYLMLLKALRWRTMLVLLPVLLLAEGLTWGFLAFRTRSNLHEKLQAYWWIVSNWSKIMRERRRVQASRRVGDRVLLEACTHRLAYEQAEPGVVASLAHLVFDPLFFVLLFLLRLLVRW